MTDLFRKILISNDDGVHAQGIEHLYDVAKKLSDDVWVIAPDLEQSGASHSLTIRKPLRIRKLGEKKYSVDGTPTDSVLVGINHILKDDKPSLILSGINNGSNIGDDVTYSGTVAAAMEATLLGIPSIAISLSSGGMSASKWHTALHFLPDILMHLKDFDWQPNILININFPNAEIDEISGVRITVQGSRKLGEDLFECVDPRGHKYYWIGPMRRDFDVPDNTDVAAIRTNAITITPLHLDLTHYPSLSGLEKIFKNKTGAI